MPRHFVCQVANLPPGERKILTIGPVSVGVYNVHGDYYAVRNSCPHRGAPLCLGEVSGTMLASEPGAYRYGNEGTVLSCPWHRWQFDIRTGQPIIDRSLKSVKTYAVDVVAGRVEVEV